MATANQNYQGVDNDWANAANWSASGIPTADDLVRIGGSSQGLSVNLGQGAVSPGLDGLFLAETMTGDLGATGNPLIIDADTVTCRSGASQSWFEGTYAEFIAAPMLMTDNACVIDASGGDTITNLYSLRGRVTIVDGSAITNGFVMAESGSAILVIQANTTFSGDLHINSGRVLLSGEIDGTVFLDGGILEMLIGCDVNKLVLDGGTCQFKDGDFTGGSDSVIIKGGVFDASAHFKQTTIPNMRILSNTARINLRTKANAIDITTFKNIGNAILITDDGKSYA